MARQSAAAKAASQWRADGRPPDRPSLPAAAAKLWDEILADRPSDHFRPGSLHLLAAFCRLSAELEELLRQPRESLQEMRQAQSALIQLGQMAEKLAIAPSVEARLSAGRRAEKGAKNPLLGGRATRAAVSTSSTSSKPSSSSRRART